jgi:DNA-binding NtrC family response regulator
MPDASIPKIRLLLIDDEIDFTSVMVKRLGRRGIDATTANGGHQAIALVAEQVFDVVVLDLKMEDMDGIEVLKVLKQKTPNLPVIMLTGHGSHSAAEEGFTHGAFDYLSKPYDIDGLTQIIRKAVATQTGAA